MRFLKKLSYTKLLVILYVVAQLGVIVWYAANRLSSNEPLAVEASQKVYAAVEEDGKIAVINPENQAVKYIDLSQTVNGTDTHYAPHNVQVAPDGRTVWVTGNAAGEHQHGTSPLNRLKNLAGQLSLFKKVLAHGDEEAMPAQDDSPMSASGPVQDEVIVIDAATDKIIKRIGLGQGLHLAHVALTLDSQFAFVTAQEKDLIFKINGSTYGVEQQYSVKAGSGPHGLRVAPDSVAVYIANSTGKSLGVLDIASGSLSYIPLEGQAVQTGVTADGKYVVASIYDTKSLAVYSPAAKKLSYLKLPAESKGPIQMYPTPDSRYVYLADQGYYFNQPTSSSVYKIDLVELKVVTTIKTGQAPHGVAVSKDGRRAYVTNLQDGNVSAIDTSRDIVVWSVKVGAQPNGISIWTEGAGGTP
ncbi:hypothetical protein A3E49_00525 [Candidatus Saccharibacteria bacterium RIFCSPHIGHO2_12_FULL_49_19]|nr:MAG: hypothetical protein A2708_00950 [Candidatus Saccharibacteria bacterium RIFCSPHIGHO2_01_FULL_49_21]OGL36731.1 MAG: hypothetical protein A3E49_00525 [Candidatus Saccharibacteria bacterium RIFCSPHIGHO2_12_FULL_49_19]